MLTKQDRELLISDLKQVFVTKDDLKSMETRQDAKYVTKDDLKSMEERQDRKYATKVDLKKLATKKDTSKLNKKMDLIIRFFDNDYIRLSRRVDKLEKRSVISSLQ